MTEDIRNRKVFKSLEEGEVQDEPVIEVSHFVASKRVEWVAALLSALIPGLGQFYNYQIMKFLIFNITLFFFVGGSILTIVFYTIYYLFELIFFRLYNLTLGWMLSLLNDCTNVFCTTLFTFENYRVKIMATIFSIVTSFPAPPLSGWVTHILLNYSTAVTYLFIGGMVIIYLFQIYDAFSVAGYINSGKLKIKYSRKRQFVQLSTENILPYLFLLLPIPYVNLVVQFLFCSSSTITEFLDYLSAEDNKHLDKSQLVKNHVKQVFFYTSMQFALYSGLYVLAAIYLLIYIFLIIFWLLSGLYGLFTFFLH